MWSGLVASSARYWKTRSTRDFWGSRRRTVPHFPEREPSRFYHFTPDPVTEAFDERATYCCLSALLATTHEKAADRIHSNALKSCTASA